MLLQYCLMTSTSPAPSRPAPRLPRIRNSARRTCVVSFKLETADSERGCWHVAASLSVSEQHKPDKHGYSIDKRPRAASIVIRNVQESTAPRPRRQSKAKISYIIFERTHLLLWSLEVQGVDPGGKWTEIKRWPSYEAKFHPTGEQVSALRLEERLVMKPTTPRRPFTPVKRLLNCFKPKPTVNLGKRSRSLSCSSTHSPSPLARKSKAKTKAKPSSMLMPCPFHPTPVVQSCVAVESDSPISGSVIITTFPVPPFCCHAHLHSMDREQLRSVAQTINSRLPLALGIDTTASRTDTQIRRDIEVFVGLRKPEDDGGEPRVPGAPKAIRSRTVTMGPPPGVPPSGCRRRQLASPKSPLAGRRGSRAFSMALGSPMLDILEEEDDEDGTMLTIHNRKSVKRRKLGLEDPGTPTPVRRAAMKQRVVSHGGGSVRPNVAGRTRSKTVPDVRAEAQPTGERPVFKFDPSFVNCAPRYRPRRRAQQEKTSGLASPRAYTTDSLSGLASPLESGSSSPVACSTPHRRGKLADASFDLDGMEDSDSDEEFFDSLSEL
ncbi:hypothetical protein GLOTRDRAFT_96345 [Gloeophyllum trabeum ATCC 11539]|uniref:Uncharacterized protein n=1 Tax=Gloeophyllum trabeum (strain ATCC 11539 / FP-39264 / Madison 617) TaxID=670483 RepID=S7PVG5_GLOTA|nr:uncharacterized protein GLOTRDRAFT_96345 [Gloeophyllum trabeum ATCC 11539]EPQ51626.1 hypothetical protein GLOTRDRAFT_96345 [Gloeophyllum trabeum ATCC 11539]